jgi:hypothetical protein
MNIIKPTKRLKLAEKSLSRIKPWNVKKYPKSFPAGWEWNAESRCWNQPPKNWRFNGRYWVQIPTCRLYLNEKCKDGAKCQKYHPELPWLGSAKIEEPDEFEAEIEEKNIATTREEDDPVLQASIKALQPLLAFEGFKGIPNQIIALHQRTEIFKDQGRDLREECGNMGLVLRGNEGFDYDKAAELYHKYLDASGYFPNGSKYVTFLAKMICPSCICRYGDYDYTTASSLSCVNEAPNGSESAGTLLIKEAENLCRQGRQRIQSIQRNCKRLTLVVALQQKETPKSLDDILAACPLHLQLPIEHQLQRVVKALLKSVEKKFTRGMKFEGGPDGRYVQLCARRILKDHDKDDDIDKGIDSALQKVYDRQLKRLMGMKERKDKTRNLDNLLLTAEDLLGAIIPDASKFQIKEWEELQGMIGLDAVKLSIRSLMDGLLLNYYRELNEQEPLKISLSRLFLGPPGTGKSYHLCTITLK